MRSKEGESGEIRTERGRNEKRKERERARVSRGG